MRRRRALRAKILARLHDPLPKIRLPESIHRHPRRQRVLAAHQPLRQVHPIPRRGFARSRRRQPRKVPRHVRLHLFAQHQKRPAHVQSRLARRRQLGHHQRRRELLRPLQPLGRLRNLIPNRLIHRRKRPVIRQHFPLLRLAALITRPLHDRRNVRRKPADLYRPRRVRRRNPESSQRMLRQLLLQHDRQLSGALNIHILRRLKNRLMRLAPFGRNRPTVLLIPHSD